jgi:hypothetical protein
MAAVAIWEWMYQYEPVVKTDGNFVVRVDSGFDPSLGVVEQLPQLNWYQPIIDSNIPLAGPKLACPPPHVTEHVFVQIPDELLGQQITTAG